MTLLDTHARTGRMSRVNPVAKLGAAAAITIPLVLTLDVVSATVALVLELMLMPLAGLGWREFWARTWIVWALAPLTGLTLIAEGDGLLRVPGRAPIPLSPRGTGLGMTLSPLVTLTGRRGVDETLYRQRLEVLALEGVVLRFEGISSREDGEAISDQEDP